MKNKKIQGEHMLKINVTVGKAHTMEIPEGMKELLEEFFSTFELDGELNFILAKKLKGRSTLQGRVCLISVNLTTGTLTINAQPGENGTRHALTTKIPNGINYSNFEDGIREKITELEKPREKEIEEKKIFQKCLKLFYALDGKFRAGINRVMIQGDRKKKRIYDEVYKPLGYNGFESLYNSVIRPAIKFKLLMPDGRKGETIYEWTKMFLVKKDEYEENQTRQEKPAENSDKSSAENLLVGSLEMQTEESPQLQLNGSPLPTKEELQNMSDDDINDLYNELGKRLVIIKSDVKKLQEEQKYIDDLSYAAITIVEKRQQEAKIAIESVWKKLEYLSGEEILKIVRDLQ